MNLKKSLGIAGAALALAIAPAVVAPAAHANHASGGPIVTYSYHYDNRCQWNIQFAGEPFYKGYIYRVWYRTTHVDYSDTDNYWHGFKDYSTTAFSHREYPRQIRCAGGAW